MTACSWDVKLPLDRLWQEWKRIIKPKGAIALFGTQPFTSELVMSNRKWFKYEWIWEKTMPTGIMNASHRPLKAHENILIFSEARAAFNQFDPTPPMTYNPQGVTQASKTRMGKVTAGAINNIRATAKEYLPQAANLPRTVITFSNGNAGSSHPTQKPIALLQYLIRTYTNEGDTVLDSTCGSGSTLVAAQSINRKAIGIELDPGYCAIAASRLGSLEPELIKAEGRKTGQLTIFDEAIAL